MVQPKGGGEKLFDTIIPRVSDVAASVKDAIAYGLEKTEGAGKYAHDGIPFCLLPGHEQRYDDLKTHRFATMIEIGEPDFFPVDDRAKVQPPECDACTLRGPCPGLYAGYREVHGDGEIHPVTAAPRSNSFTFVREAVVGKLVDGACPIRADGVTPWDRGRIVFLREGDSLVRYRTESRDFTDLEIEATKHELGQLYVDVSSKGAPDDFARDLRKLSRSATCAGCAHETSCAGMFERRSDDVFTRDDAFVRDLVASLRGDVLDVGCGDGRYEDALAPLVAVGAMRYVGLEPSPERVAALRSRWPWATIHEGDAESLDVRGAYDHVLVLRSWNHLRDPGRALLALAASLRPGGTLTVVDNVAFGLLRGSEHARRAAHGPAAFEHYRNDDASKAHARIAAYGFELVERRDVGAATSDQWLLRYRKAQVASGRDVAAVGVELS